MRGAKRRMPVKALSKLAGAMKASAAAPLPAPAVMAPTAPPAAPAGPVAPPPMPMGATDGLGSGQGGLAVHPSLKGFAIHGREPRHTSRTR